LSFQLAYITLAVGVCSAQVFTANLTGLVTDPNQSVIPGASVRIKNVGTNAMRQTFTRTEGRYTFSQLEPGTYEVTVEAPGFKSTVEKGVTLVADQSGELNVSMQVGDVTQTVEVVENSAVLDTQTANQAVTLDAKQFLELPINARNPFFFVNATAGVVAVRTGISESVQDSSQGRFALNGGRDEGALMMIDGVPATSADWSALLAVPNTDSIREVQIVRNSYEAQYGKSGGGVVDVVSKSGSQEFHGMAWDFLRNNHLDANTWAQNKAGLPIPVFQRNQFGANFSGPLWKSKKLFFFGGYDGDREGSPSPYLNTVPTALQRQGDFSQTFNANGALSVIYNPFTTAPNPNGAGFVRDPFPGNRIPSSLIDPVGAATVGLFPNPNLSGTAVTQANNFFGSGKSATTQDRMDLRFDWVPSEKHSFFVRITRTNFQTLPPAYFGNGADSNFASVIPRHQVALGYTFVPTPTWVINVLIGTGRFREQQISPGRGLDGTKIGLPAAMVSQFDVKTIPQFVLNGYAQLGNSRVLDDARNTHNLQVNVTKERGAHSIKFGFEAEAGQVNSTDSNSANFTFNRGMTSGPIAAVDSSTSGNTIASLLLGTGATGDAPKPARNAITQMYYAWYGQDTWRITPRLTINLGLRYELQLGRTERYDRLDDFDFTIMNPLGSQVGLPLRGGLVFLNSNRRGLWATDFTSFAPRIGISMKLTNKLVVRTGYGIFYPQAAGSGPTAAAGGFATDTSWVSSRGGDSINPQALLRNPFPGGINQPVGSSQGLATLAGQAIDAFQRVHPAGYIQNYSLDMQYQVARDTIIELGYAGNQSRKLLYGAGSNSSPYSRNADQLPTALLSMGAALDRPVPNPFYGVITSGLLSGPTIPANQLLRPYPQFTAVNVSSDTPGASASFNALVAKVTKQFTGGVTVVSSYQWSKAIDNASETQGWEINEAFRDYYNQSIERSISAHDVPQSWVTSAAYELPVGKGKKFGASMPAVAEAIIGGWEVSTITSIRAGLPLQVTAANNLASYGFVVMRPNIASLHNLDLPNRTPSQWFNTSAFTVPPPFTLGNAPRFFPNLRTDWARNVDFALMKRFRYRERLRAQFRAEAFNLFNTPQFAAANTNLASPSFGTVTSTLGIPRNIQLALKLDF
jgi:hypothetical protein